MPLCEFRQMVGKGWLDQLNAEFDEPYMERLAEFILKEKRKGAVYPSCENIFDAFSMTPFDAVKVVILGQDPYHREGQAHGLSFSVPENVALPPSLKNIYKEIEREYGTSMPESGNLAGWARQGVLLLNTTLTVRQGEAGSHQGSGWEKFTDAVIGLLNRRRKNIVYILWGNHARKKGALIDRNANLVLEGVHPSPLSAHRGFIGCGHFLKANEYLESHHLPCIDWTRPN